MKEEYLKYEFLRPVAEAGGDNGLSYRQLEAEILGKFYANKQYLPDNLSLGEIVDTLIKGFIKDGDIVELKGRYHVERFWEEEEKSSVKEKK